MARESTQHKLDRVRPPRVQITYDVETGDAIEVKELPFVLGMLADLSGKPEEPLPRLRASFWEDGPSCQRWQRVDSRHRVLLVSNKVFASVRSAVSYPASKAR